ncbi:MAG: hypothetical protein J6V47_06495 [Bacteroidaceae bacterium]|nr:hypothetical protein [Bacteroidaceae bacterium]
MKIAIHKREGSFSDDWIKYCENNNVDYKIVNAYSSNIIEDLKDCDAFMWHHRHGAPNDVLFAKQLLASIQASGKATFPDINTGWHFDDKVGQKYLLESIQAPLVPSFVFYSKKDAVEWINTTSFPKVFKLRGGAGAVNVKLVKDKKSAIKLINKAFGNGFSPSNSWNSFKDRISDWRKGKAPFIHVIKGFIRLLYKNETNKYLHREKGYAYFQEFIPDNKYDTRLIVVHRKALGERRFVRKNDFRASGSGEFSYDGIDERIVKVAFDVADKLKLQSVAFDFVKDKEGNPLIVEMSYCFGTKGAKRCPGYWTDDMQWHPGENIDFCGWMVENIIEEVNCKNKL